METINMKTTYWWIIGIILFASVIRLYTFVLFPGYFTLSDTVSYYLTAQSFVEKHTIIDPWRVPVYPLLIAGVYALNGVPMTGETPQGTFTYALWDIRVMQHLGGIALLILLFLLLVRLGISKLWAGIFCLFTAWNLTLLVDEMHVATEALAALWLIGTLYLAVRCMERFVWWRYAVLGVLFVFGVFLRPNYVLFPFLVVPFIVWRHWKRKIFIYSIILLAIYSAFLLLYSQANYAMHAYRGISRISDVNMLGKILQYRLPLDQLQDATGIEGIVKKFIADYGLIDPWQVYIRNVQLYDSSLATPMSRFVWNVIMHNIGTYLWRPLLDIPAALMEMSDALYGFYKTNFFGKWGNIFINIYHYLQLTTYAIFIAIPVFTVDALRKKSVRNIGFLLLTMTGVYHVIFYVYFAYSEYGRLLSPAQPILFLVSFMIWVRTARWMYGQYKRLLRCR
jgi:hypothetical protein